MIKPKKKVAAKTLKKPDAAPRRVRGGKRAARRASPGDDEKIKKGKAKIKAKAGKVKAKKEAPAKELTNRQRLIRIYSKGLDQVEKDVGLITNEMAIRTPASTGVLVLDLLMGGGMLPGMYQVSGLEGSGKTTLSMQVLDSALTNDVPLALMFDPEGTLGTNPEYASRILFRHEFKNIFMPDENGIRRARYYQSQVIEDFYDYVKAATRWMPDKVYKRQAEGWFYRFSRDKFQRGMIADMGLTPDKAFKDPKYSYVPAEHSGIEGTVIMDSYASLVSRAEDETDDGQGGMAIDARSFSKNIKRVVARLQSKGINIWGINQLRLRPAVRYGNPEYEPGGEALKFYSAWRARVSQIVPPPGWDRSGEKGQKHLCIEPSVEGRGDDLYQFINIQNTKNKYSTPFLGSTIRIWTRDHTSKGRGVDPVLDVFNFYSMIGALEGRRKGPFVITVKNGKTIKFSTWAVFKEFVIAEFMGKKFKATAEKLKLEPFRLRAHGFSLLASGKANPVAHHEILDDDDGDDEDDEY